MENTIRINLNIDVHHLSFIINPEKEADYRQAAILLNERYNTFKKARPQQTPELLWLQIALECCINLLADSREKAIQPVLAQMNVMSDKIEKILKHNEQPTEPLNPVIKTKKKDDL